MIKQISKIIITLMNIFFIVLTVGLLFIAIFKKEWFEIFIEWMKVEIQGWGSYNYIIVFLSAFIEAFPVLGVVIPGQNILLIVGGFFAQIGKITLIYVIIMSSLGAILGNYIGYILGKKYGDSFFDMYGIRFGIGKTEVRYLKKGIDKWGALGITLGKFHPMTRAFLPFIAGSMQMKSSKFMLYNAIGSIIRSSTIVLFGVVFATYYKVFLEYSGTISLLILGTIAGYIYFYKKAAFLTYLKEKNQEMEALSKK